MEWNGADMIHQYKLNGYNIVLDVCSGAVHVVDDAAYDAIAWYEECDRGELVKRLTARYGEQGVTPAEAEALCGDIQSLIDAGKLFSPDPYANLDLSSLRAGGVVKALCLHVAHTCNLSCDYCFASQGKYHGDRALMSFEVGKQALDFLMEHSGGRTNLEVDFFGGEPLMNWDVVKRLVAYAREHGAKAEQALPLYPDHQRDAARRRGHGVCQPGDAQCRAVPRRTQGDSRPAAPDPLGQGSYDRIVPKFQRAGRQPRPARDITCGGPLPIYNTDFVRGRAPHGRFGIHPAFAWSRWSARPATPTP